MDDITATLPETSVVDAAALAPAPSRLVLELNDRWRLTEDDLQWVLQRKAAGGRWICSRFCRSRAGLQRCVSELCGHEADPAVPAQIADWPEFHS